MSTVLGGGGAGSLVESGAVPRAPHRPSEAQYRGLLAARHGDRRQRALRRQERLAAGARPDRRIALDLGVSSMQIDDPERGFSFRFDGPLDMRMGRHGTSAADLVAICWAISGFEFDPDSAKSALPAGPALSRRRGGAADPTNRRACGVRGAVPTRELGLTRRRDVQALRIAVNDELGELIGPGCCRSVRLPLFGRLAVVSLIL